MKGLFDDLTPESGSASAFSGLFDDLVPEPGRTLSASDAKRFGWDKRGVPAMGEDRRPETDNAPIYTGNVAIQSDGGGLPHPLAGALPGFGIQASQQAQPTAGENPYGGSTTLAETVTKDGVYNPVSTGANAAMEGARNALAGVLESGVDAIGQIALPINAATDWYRGEMLDADPEQLRSEGREEAAAYAERLQTARSAGMDEQAFSSAITAPLSELADVLYQHASVNREAIQEARPENALFGYAHDVWVSVARMGPQLAAGRVTGNANVGLGVMFADIYGSEFQRGINESGLTRDEAMTQGLIKASLEVAPEKLFGVFERFIKPGASFNRLKQAAAEGGSEAFTEISNIIDDAWRHGETELSPTEILGRVSYAFALGVGMGAVIGPGSAPPEFDMLTGNPSREPDPPPEPRQSPVFGNTIGQQFMNIGQATQNMPSPTPTFGIQAAQDVPIEEEIRRLEAEVKQDQTPTMTAGPLPVEQQARPEAVGVATVEPQPAQEPVPEPNPTDPVAQNQLPKIKNEAGELVPFPDPRLKRETYRGTIKQLASELRVGGDITLVPRPGAVRKDNTGDVVWDYGADQLIRTKSVNPAWFQSIAEDEGVSVKFLQSTIAKALAGRTLGVRQHRVIERMLDVVWQTRMTGTDQLGAEPIDFKQAMAQARSLRADARRAVRGELTDAEADALAALERDEADAGTLFEEDAYLEELNARERAAYEMAEEARAANEAATIEAIENARDDIALAAQLYDIAYGRTSANPEGFDPQESGAEQGQPAEAPSPVDEAAGQAATSLEEKAGGKQDSDLAGPVDQTAQIKADADRKRDEKINQSPEMIEGDGELFAGPRPPQADLFGPKAVEPDQLENTRNEEKSESGKEQTGSTGGRTKASTDAAESKRDQETGEKADVEEKPEAVKPGPTKTGNRLITDQAAEDARKLLLTKLGQLNTGLDPEVFKAGVTLATYHIERGARSFAEYARAMINDLGAMVKPYLKAWYMGVKYDPSASKLTDLDSASAVDQANIDEILEVAPDFRNMEPAADQNAASEAENDDSRASPEDVRAGAEGLGAESAPESETGAEAGLVPEPADEGILGNEGVPAGAGGGASKPDRGSGVQGGSDGTGSGDQQPVQGGGRRGNRPGNRADRGAADYRIRIDEIKRDGGWRIVAERNVEIVELVQKITAENRQAKPEEKALLVKFTGWGASEIANGIFPNHHGRFKNEQWQALGERLKAALTPEQYAEASRTTQYAHYTSEPVIRSVYAGLERLGFAGGDVFEPGAGIGLFRGLMPDQIFANSTYTAVEYDTITGRIAQLLYPGSNITIGDYTKTKFPEGFFSAAVGNPPFSSLKVTSDPKYRKNAFLLHDYFFAKTIDLVEPGGLLVFVTSKGTMDKANDRARKYLSERANLLGAIRLPQTAFKDNAGTEVVTDVLFLQKLGDGIEDNGFNWMDLGEVDTPQGRTRINRYFAEHPEMVLGTHALSGSMYRADEYTVIPKAGVPIEQAFAEAVANLPENVYRPRRGTKAETAKVIDSDINPNHNKEGGVYVDDTGQLRIIQDGVGVPLTARENAQGKKFDLSQKQIRFMKDYVGVRKALKQAQSDQLNDGPWEKSLKALNDAHGAFVRKHGWMLEHSVTERENKDGSVTIIRRFKNKALLDLDAENALIYGMERWDQSGKMQKGKFMLDRTIKRPEEPKIETVQDALFVSLNDIGRLDIEEVAKLAGASVDDAIAELGTSIYFDPSHGWATADKYLSGNVVSKLREAEAAAKTDPSLKRNVEALKAVQPEPLAPSQITAQLGAAWVPASDVQAFAADALGSPGIKVKYNPVLAKWKVGGYSSSVSEWAAGGMDVGEILESVLSNRTIRITSKESDGKTHPDLESTEAANQAAKKMREAFKGWIWSDKARANRLVQFYNENFNNIVPRQFDGSHLTLPGVSTRFKLYPHQKRAIWRMIQDGNTYLAHSVGAGKTFTMIAAGMEERRLGISKKPMYVVPNHMLDQFAREFLELYPAANIMVASPENFHTSRRHQFVAQAALNNPDAIIITHSAFGRIGLGPKRVQSFINEQIDDLRIMLENVENGDRITVKRIEKKIEALEQKLKESQKEEAKDKAVLFEEIGVDRLFVDEAHEFRKLHFAMSRGAVKGIDSSGSQMAMDLFMKARYLETNNPGRSLIMASGTPVTNTMGELFSIQRFFQMDQLAEDGLDSFDAWSTHFGEVVEGFEQNAAGGYEVVSRFAKFVNVPDLMTRIRTFMDVLTSDQLGPLVQRPMVDGGQRKVVVTPTPDGYKEYQKTLESRIRAIRNRKGPPNKGDDIILSVIKDGRFSAIDMRFVDPRAPSDPKSKLNVVIDNIIDAYHETADFEYQTNGKKDELNGASILVFSDIGLGAASAKNSGFDMRAWMTQRLVEAGVKPNDIAFIADYATPTKKERLFADMREGRKRIMIGSKNMETGVNVQKRLRYLFHVDAPWFPASVEQREGRIIRQGNQNQKVTIRAFATKGSYDATMWGMNARKARFIEQSMTGGKSERSMEDVSEASQFEIAAALASGDERYLKLAGMKSDVERLERLYRAHMDQQNKYQASLISNRDRVESNKRLIAKLEAEIKKRKPVDWSGDAPSAFVGGEGFTDRNKFSEALFSAFKAEAEKNTEAETVVGKIGGFEIVYTGVTFKGSGNYIASLDLNMAGQRDPLVTWPIDPNVSVVGIGARATNQVSRLDRDLADLREGVENAGRMIEQLESRIGAEFAELGELTEKLSAVDDLEAELAAEGDGNSESEQPPTDGQMYSRRDPVLYSAVERAVEGIQQNRAQPQQWLAMVRKQPGVKQEELDWMGLGEWLGEQQGSVTREQVLDFVRSNAVEVQEVTLGAPNSIGALRSRMPSWFERLDGAGVQAHRDVDGRIYFTDGSSDRMDRFDVREKHGPMVGAAAEAVSERNPEDDIDPKFRSKFHQYQTSGGENYRELLLTLPISGIEEAKARAKRADERRVNAINKFSDAIRNYARENSIDINAVYTGRKKAPDGFVASWNQLRSRDIDTLVPELRESAKELQDALLEYESTTLSSGVSAAERAGGFKSSHFDAPNILAHVRFNERTDADGKRVLFIEEVQSDWHQAGRKKGYGATKIDVVEKQPGRFELVDRQSGETIRMPDGVVAYTSREAAEAEVERAAEVGYGVTKGVPDAPFKQSWPMLAMKRMIRYAAENGLDRIAWTPGDVQADRYDLSKQLSELYHWVDEDGDYGVSAYALDGSTVIDQQTFRESELEGAVGKEVANRIINREGDQASADMGGNEGVMVLSGEGLKIGGEGMRAFYDRILKNEVGKYVKKFGARVGTTEIRTDKASLQVWSVDVTPAMREAALAGQPMFARGQSSGTTAEAIRAALSQKAQQALIDSGLLTITDTPAQWPGQHPSDAAGMWMDGRIYLAAANIEPGGERGLILHEIGVHHGLESMVGAKKFQRLLGQIKRQAERGGRPGAPRAARDAYLAHQRALADKTLRGRPEAALWEETIAYMAEDGATGGAFQEIVAAIRAFLRSIGLDLQFTAADVAHLARGSVSMIVAGEAAGAGIVAPASYSFAGINAATADRGTMIEARDRLRRGEDADRVRRETGWFRGADRKLRFEINDSDASLVDLDLEDGRAVRSKMLGDILDHPALFDAYPELRDMLVTISVSPDIASESGSYKLAVAEDQWTFGRDPEISVSARTADGALSVLLHEIQHGIQNIEGFATGGTPEGQKLDAEMEKGKVDIAYERFNEFERALFGGETLSERVEQLGEQLADGAITEEEFHQLSAEYAESLDRAIAQNPFVQNDIKIMKRGSMGHYQRYLQLAGEVESRNVQKRQKLGDRGRRMVSPESTQDIPSSDVIVMFNGKDAASAPMPANAVQNQTKTPEFRAWFGDSKVVDQNGEPLVVYHGTTKDFAEFRPGYALGWGRGIYFSNNPDAVEEFSYGEGGRTIPVYVMIEKPFRSLVQDRKHFQDADVESSSAWRNAKERNGLDEFSYWEEWFNEDGEFANDLIREMGFDGIISEGSNSIDGLEIVAFRPEQIKSATGNFGTFDPLNPDIRYSRRRRPPPNWTANFNISPKAPQANDLKEAMEKAGMPERRSTLERSADLAQRMTWANIKRGLRQGLGDTRQGVLDRFYGLKLAETRIAGNLPHEQSAYVAARFSTGSSSVMRGLMLHGAPEWRDGVVSKIAGSKGLLAILEPVKGDLQGFFGWMIARRAQRLAGEGRENLFEQRHIDALIANAKASPFWNSFESTAKELDAFRKAVLDLADQAGLIDPIGRAAWDSADYIPFYRLTVEDSVRAPRGRLGLSGQSSGIRMLRGGTAELNDPLENILMNFTHLVDASMKNHALILAELNLRGSGVMEKITSDYRKEFIPLSQIRALLKKSGVDVSLIPRAALEGIAKLWSIKPPSGKNVVRLMRDGKAEYYRVNDPLLLRSLTAIQDPGLNSPSVRVMRSFKRIFTRGITSDPTFMLRNFARDSLHAWVINRDHFIIGADSVRGAIKSLSETGGSVDMLFAGASFQGGYVNANDPGEASRSIRRALREKGYSASAANNLLASVLDSPAKVWEAYTQIGDAIENSNREAVYEAAIRAGKGRAQALFESKDLMDYSLRGDFAAYQLLTDVVPFLNAHVQGVYKLGRASASHPGHVFAKGSVLMIAALALLARNWDDERYRDLPDWEKDTYWHFYLPFEIEIGGVKVDHVRFPKPFEVGLIFGTMPERVALNMLGDDDNRKTFERFLWGLRETLSFNPMPHAAMPIIEVISNKSFFTNSPIETMSDEGKLKEARFNAYTSPAMRALGKFTGPTVGLSPKELEHLWNGYLGTMGTYALGAVDTLVRAAGDGPPRPTLRIDDLPVIKGFFRAEPARSTKWMQTLYDLRTELNEINATMNAAAKAGDQEEYDRIMNRRSKQLRGFTRGEALASRAMINDAAKFNSNVRRQLDMIAASETMTPDERRARIDELMAARNDYTKQTVQSVLQFFREKAELQDENSDQ